MKKIIIALFFVLLSSQAYTSPPEDVAIANSLHTKLALLVCDHSDFLKKSKIVLDGLAWGEPDYIYPGSVVSYPINLIAGTRYVFYTLTNGTYVTTGIFGYEPKSPEIALNGPSIYTIAFFTAQVTGEYRFIVHSVDSRKGINCSCFMFVVK